MSKQKTIYDLKLHESISIKDSQRKDDHWTKDYWYITRVPGGWIYQDLTEPGYEGSALFVPFNDEFKDE